ncbi:MAG: TIGR01906 family membrane protein [Chloroflexi bacterium]|nr:TIGR01906 family membrane protein [Chloroflexota bacterium]
MLFTAFIKALLTLLFLLAIPTFLLATNVRWAVNEIRLYEYGFNKYEVSATTGLEKEELTKVAREIRDYFNSNQELLEVNVRLRGKDSPLFNEREVLHMKDVKGLVQGVYRAQQWSGGYILLYVIAGLVIAHFSFLRPLIRYAMWGGAITLSLVIVAGIAILAGFEKLFLIFHIVSFQNSLWQLDPQRDYLIMMFPPGFFFDATKFIALATVAEALALSGSTYGVLRWLPRGGRAGTGARASRPSGRRHSPRARSQGSRHRQPKASPRRSRR